MAIFHCYVKLPEGRCTVNTTDRGSHAPWMDCSEDGVLKASKTLGSLPEALSIAESSHWANSLESEISSAKWIKPFLVGPWPWWIRWSYEHEGLTQRHVHWRPPRISHDLTFPIEAVGVSAEIERAGHASDICVGANRIPWIEKYWLRDASS